MSNTRLTGFSKLIIVLATVLIISIIIKLSILIFLFK